MVKVADKLMYEAKRYEKGGFRHMVVGLDEPTAVTDSSPRREHPLIPAQVGHRL